MAIPTSNITENYDALKILRESHLNTAMDYIDMQFNTYTKNNFLQLALDVFGASYVFDNDGLANNAGALNVLSATIADNETITGAWTFSGALTISNTVTSSSKFTATGQPRCRAYLSSAVQSIGDATLTAINFDAETYDVGAMHDTSTATNRVTVPAGSDGIYIIHAQVTFAANATGKREAFLYKNAAALSTAREIASSGTEETVIHISVHDTATAGDYYELRVNQNRGGALNVENGTADTFIEVIKVW